MDQKARDDRDDLIYSLRSSGKSLDKLGNEFGLSTARIEEICAAVEKRQAFPADSAQMPVAEKQDSRQALTQVTSQRLREFRPEGKQPAPDTTPETQGTQRALKLS